MKHSLRGVKQPSQSHTANKWVCRAFSKFFYIGFHLKSGGGGGGTSSHLGITWPGVPDASGCLCSADGRRPTPSPPGKTAAYPGQADSSRDLVRYILPVDMAHPGAGDVLHAASTHPHLQGEKGER